MEGWKEIGSMIKIDRVKRNLSQAEYADLIGVTQQTVGAWEKGRSIRDDYWEAILSVSGIDVGALVEHPNFSRQAYTQKNVGVGYQANKSVHINQSQQLPHALQYLNSLILQHDENDMMANNFIKQMLNFIENK